MSPSPHLKFLQGAENLRLAANMYGRPNVEFPAPPGPGRQAVLSAAMGLSHQAGRRPAANTCQQRLQLAFYFDGPGQLLNGAPGATGPSNVASLYQSRVPDSSADAVYSFYVPGLGAPFKDIGDPGDVSEAAYLSRGEARLQWALDKVEERRAAADKLCGIDVYLFGFSRGAALARAFANRLGTLGRPEPRGIALAAHPTVDLEVRFMGLWDTVAAIGPTVTDANIEKLGLTNESYVPDRRDQSIAAKSTWRQRHVSAAAYTLYVPSASQLLTWAQTHPGWTREMAIPAWVKTGTHLIAGHENRNSLPVETTLNGRRQPPAFVGEEHVYPGTHFDLGGGYPDGSATRPGRQLASVALNVMHEKAVRAGAPLRLLDDPKTSPAIRLMFARATPSDPAPNQAAAAGYAALLELWRAYVRVAAETVATSPVDEPFMRAHSLGSWFFAHARLRYASRLTLMFDSADSPETARKPPSGPAQPLQAVFDTRLALDASYLFEKNYQAQRRFQVYDALANLNEAHSSQFADIDDRVYEFLDSHLHLAGDGALTDATLPSDPRVAYVGGEEWLQFSNDAVRECAFARPNGFPFVSSETLAHRWAVPYSVSATETLGFGASVLARTTGRTGLTTSQALSDALTSVDKQVLTVGGQTIEFLRDHAPKIAAKTNWHAWTSAQLVAAVAKLPPFLRDYLKTVLLVPFPHEESTLQKPTLALVRNRSVLDTELAPSTIYFYLVPETLYTGEILDRTMVHECTHLMFDNLWHQEPEGVGRWERAMRSDGRVPSKYAGEYGLQEDAAEFIVLFVSAMYTPCETALQATFAARFAEARRLVEEAGFRRELALSDWPAR